MYWTFQGYCERTALDLNRLSQSVEDSVIELIRIFMNKAKLEGSSFTFDGPEEDVDNCE